MGAYVYSILVKYTVVSFIAGHLFTTLILERIPHSLTPLQIIMREN
mgnify:CR=1 FL=1